MTTRAQKAADARIASALKATGEKYNRDGYVRCRVCGCSEFDACFPPCAWQDYDLCDTCHVAVQALECWTSSARRPNMAALLRELKRRMDVPVGHVDRGTKVRLNLHKGR